MKLKPTTASLGTVILFLTLTLSLFCFPIIAMQVSSLGLTSTELYSCWLLWNAQVMFYISVVVFFISQNLRLYAYPIIIAIPVCLIYYYGELFNNGNHLIDYIIIAVLGLAITMGCNFYFTRFRVELRDKAK